MALRKDGRRAVCRIGRYAAIDCIFVRRYVSLYSGCGEHRRPALLMTT